jgi:hypothetical protein
MQFFWRKFWVFICRPMPHGTARHGLPGPKIPDRVRLACRAGFGPDFGTRTSGRVGLRLAENVI